MLHFAIQCFVALESYVQHTHFCICLEFKLLHTVSFFVTGKKEIFEFIDKHPSINHEWFRIRNKITNDKRAAKDRVSRKLQQRVLNM